MTMSTTDRARLAALARHSSRSPAARREIARRAFLTGAVRAVIERTHELTAEQRAAVMDALTD